MKTIIAAFRDQAAADQAIAFLHDKGIDDIELMRRDGASDRALSHLRELNVPDDRAHLYADVMQQGAPVLAAHTDKDADEIARELDRLGSLDLEEGGPPERMEAERAERTREMTTEPLPGAVGGDLTGAPAGGEVDVIEEQVVVGKRDVDRGGVRVHTYVVERPVHADVQLTDERIDVTREAANEPISSAAAEAALTEEEFVVTARGEEAVVGKEARIVERVHVGKTAETHTESIEETERRRDVEVEPISTTETTTQRGSGPDRGPRR